MALSDVRVGQSVTGLVMNSSSFGSFVDIGLEKDGLVHSSKSKGIQLSPNQTVRVLIESIKGDRIALQLLEVV